MNQSRRDFVRSSACGVAGMVLGAGFERVHAKRTGRPRPNILFIMTDQQTMRAMSACGNTYLNTPNMDSLAAGGLRFEKSYCTSPVCSPSRSSILTGRMPHETGVEVNGLSIRQGVANMGDIFRRAGYETAYTGKWHLDKESGFEFLPPRYPEGVRHSLGSDTDKPWTDEAVRFLKKKHGKPFLLFVSLHNPHDICYWISGKSKLVERAETRQCPPLPSNFAVDPDEPEFITKCRQRTYYGNEANYTTKWDENQWRQYLYAYYRLTERVDKEVGRVLKALREQGLEYDTLIVFTSDHGEGCAAHKWVVKLMLYEEPVTVPFVISYKGMIPVGAVDKRHLVSSIDIVPTLCDYAGIEPPSEVAGVSLRAVIERPELAGRGFVVAELMPDTKDPAMKGRMLRTNRYKYVAFSQGRNPEMFFDLEADPGEIRNLASSPAMQGELARHRILLANWISRTSDDFVMPGKS